MSVLAFSFIVAYLWIIVLVLIGSISPWALIVLLTIKKPISAVNGFKKGEKEPQYMRVAMKSTAITNTLFSFVLSIGLFISYII